MARWLRCEHWQPSRPFRLQNQASVEHQPGNGNLLQFIVDRPFNIGANTPLVTTIDLDGFSLPPSLGAVGNTSGVARTLVVDTTPAHTPIAGTTASLPLSLVAGNATWPIGNPPAVSGSFTLNAGSYVLRQVFDLDGMYACGPGGFWLVDFPLISSIGAVPEPSARALMALGALPLFVAVRRRAPGR